MSFSSRRTAAPPPSSLLLLPHSTALSPPPSSRRPFFLLLPLSSSSRRTTGLLHPSHSRSPSSLGRVLPPLHLFFQICWEDTLLLTLTSFGVTYGDFWLHVRTYVDNAVKGRMTVDQTEPASANENAYIHQTEASNDFIKSLFNTNRLLFNIIKDLPTSYAEELFGVGEGSDMHTSGKSDRFPVYVYWIMRCAIVAAKQIIILSSRGLDQYGFVSTKVCLSRSGCVILDQDGSSVSAEKWSEIPIYLRYHSDVVEMMRRVINPEKDVLPLYHSVTNRKDNLDVLKGKRLLLLISGLNIAPEDITNLKHVTIDSERDEIVWIPILKHSISGSDDVKNQLETLQNLMPWYSIYQPSVVDEAAIEAFRIEWGFKDRPILVVLSPEVGELNTNAIYMLRIWQNLPVDNLTSEAELQLWEKETWNLKLLVNDIDPTIQEWIRDGSYILMYGGNDIDWIRKFIRQAQSVSCNLLVNIEIVYVGNSHNKDRGCKMQDVIMTEKLSHCLPESNIAYFWSRINNMIGSKDKLGKMNDPNDKLLQEILRLKSHEEWALLAKGSTIIGQGPGRIAMTALEEIEKWRTMSLK
ncbi:hypothetical protein KSS87_007656 [Heliosperma pusillum]|nr:hypothetical protein KSS87_007656 [Heliosperma pusillum]